MYTDTATNECLQADNGAPRCRVCQSQAVTFFIQIRDVPTVCNALWDTYDEARSVARGNIDLGFCEVCGHIYNYAFDPAHIHYTPTYENSLHFSPRFQLYVENLVNRLVNTYDVRGKHVVEIGCGKGDFLYALCRKGGNHGTGFDPSLDPALVAEPAEDHITFIQDLYSEKYAGYKADLICCRHVLEHVQDPTSFLQVVRKAAAHNPKAIAYFEVPDVRMTLRDLAIWDLIYEHCSYFSDASLQRLFSATGFDVRQVGSAFSDQYLWIDVSPAGSTHDSGGTHVLPSSLRRDVETFTRKYERKVAGWQSELHRIGAGSHKALIWGAGSKGVTFSNVLRAENLIPYVVDVNPRKQGKYVTGTGQEIVPPAFLLEYDPDVVILMNGIYEDEVRRILADLGVSARLLVA